MTPAPPLSPLIAGIVSDLAPFGARSAARPSGDLDRVRHLERSEQTRIGLDPPVGLLQRRPAGQGSAVAGAELDRERVPGAVHLQIAADFEAAVCGRDLGG